MRMIHEGAPRRAESLAAAVVFGWWVLRIGLDPIERLAWMPATLFDPTAPVHFLPRSLELLATTAPALITLRVLATVLALLAALGIAFRPVATLACIFLTIHQAVVRGYGHVNHAEIPILLAAWILCVSAWAGRDRREGPGGETLVTIAAVLCWGYTLAGIFRLAYAGPAAFFTDNMDCWTIDTAVTPSYFGFGLGRYVSDYRWFAIALRGGLFVVTVAEILAPFCLVSRLFRWGFLAIMIPFHVSTLLVMNILFVDNLVLFGLVLIDWWRPAIEPKEKPILLFDGECSFCNSAVDFVIDREAAGRTLFAASQSETGRALMERHGITGGQVATTVFLIEGNRVSSKATAALRVAGLLRAPWCLAGDLAPVGRFLDPVYDLVSRNRYRWFGRHDVCRIPTDAKRERFL